MDVEVCSLMLLEENFLIFVGSVVLYMFGIVMVFEICEIWGEYLFFFELGVCEFYFDFDNV